MGIHIDCVAAIWLGPGARVVLHSSGTTMRWRSPCGAPIEPSYGVKAAPVLHCSFSSKAWNPP